MVSRIRTWTAVVVAVVVSVAAVGPASARVAAPRAAVNLQIVPRGQGTIRGGAEVGGLLCTTNSGEETCGWSAPAGTRVTLTALPVGGAAVKWSVPDCAAGATTCTFTLDEDTTVVAIFGLLTLAVQTSGAEAGTFVVKSDPPGINCPETCEAKFPAGQQVVLTTTSKPEGAFTGYRYGCEAQNGTMCTVHVWDEPQSVGVEFNHAGGPSKPEVPTIKVRVAKTGNGSGDVVAGSLNCGNACTGAFEYGKLVRFSASVGAGSIFGGWGGVCSADNVLTCTLPAGPVTVLRPRFDKDSPPTEPGDVRATAATTTTVTLVWSSASDDRGIKAYLVYVGDETTPRETTTQRTVELTGLDCGKRYAVAVVAVDTGGNASARATADVATAACALRVGKVGVSLTRVRVVCRFRASGAGTGTAALRAGGRRIVVKKIAFATGTNTVAFAIPRAARGKQLRVTVQTAAGSLTWTMRAKR